MMTKLILMNSEESQKKLNTHKNGAVALRQHFGDIILIFNSQLTVEVEKNNSSECCVYLFLIIL